MTIYLSDADLANVLSYADLDEGALRTDYTGRGMFGGPCVGVVVDSTGEAMRFVFAVARQLAESVADTDTDMWEAFDLLDERFVVVSKDLRLDGMGRQQIAYLPNVQFKAA